MLSSLARDTNDHRDELLAADYRSLLGQSNLTRFHVKLEQTDLMVSACRDLAQETLEIVRFFRQQVKDQIALQPQFQTSLAPVAVDEGAPQLIRSMAQATRQAGVGPMASVAGAIAERVGRSLLELSDEVIVENGGDVFCAISHRPSFLLLAERSSFTALRVSFDTDLPAFGVCTSAGTTGHSMSFGMADAMMIAAEDTALADALASAAGNLVHGPEDLERAIAVARQGGAFAAIAIKDDRLAAWGQVQLEEANNDTAH